MPHKSVNDTIFLFFFLWKKTFKLLLATVYYVIVNFCLFWNFLSFFLFVKWVKKYFKFKRGEQILFRILFKSGIFFSFLEIYYDREKVILSLVHSKWDWNWSQNWPPGSNRRARRDFKSTILLLQFWSNFSNP